MHFWQLSKECYYLGKILFGIIFKIIIFFILMTSYNITLYTNCTRLSFYRSHLMVIAIAATTFVLLFFLILTCVQSSSNSETSSSNEGNSATPSCFKGKCSQNYSSVFVKFMHLTWNQLQQSIKYRARYCFYRGRSYEVKMSKWNWWSRWCHNWQFLLATCNLLNSCISRVMLHYCRTCK